jgi:hypothetical protein
MYRRAFAAGLAAAMVFATPAFAITAKEKMDTCKFGAADQKLTGKKEQDFIKKCMANERTPAPAPASKAAK